MTLAADQRHIAYCDIHSPANVKFSHILAWQKSFDPHRIILNGDVTLGEYASHWNEKAAFKKMGTDQIADKLEEEFRATHALLKLIREASPNAIIDWVPGNHEAWYFWIALYYPECGVILGANPDPKRFKDDLQAQQKSLLAGIIERHFKTASLGINVIPFEKPHRVGPFLYLHGHQFSSIAQADRYYPNSNTVIGHFHQFKHTPLFDSGRRGRPIEHWAVPTLQKLGRGYERVKASNHSNGFFYANVSSSGLFEGFVKKVYGDAGLLFPWQV